MAHFTANIGPNRDNNRDTIDEKEHYGILLFPVHVW